MGWTPGRRLVVKASLLQVTRDPCGSGLSGEQGRAVGKRGRMSFEELKSDLFAKGGQKDDWDLLLGGGLSYEDLVPYVAGESRESPLTRAREVMGAGRMIEYDCYDA